jgi:hypothetical protein
LELHPACAPSKGVIEVMAQQAYVAWVRRDSHAVFARDILLRPCAMSDGKASTIHRAVEDSCPDLSMDALRRLALEVPFLIYSEVPDRASSNKRKRAFTVGVCANIPNMFTSPLPGCVGHTLNTVAVRSCGEKKLVGDSHALAYTVHGTSRYNSMSDAL